MLISNLDWFEYCDKAQVMAGTSTRDILFFSLTDDLLTVKLNDTELTKIDLTKTPSFNSRVFELPGWQLTLKGQAIYNNAKVLTSIMSGNFPNGSFAASSISTYRLILNH